MTTMRWRGVLAAVLLAAAMPSCSADDGGGAAAVTPADVRRALQASLDALPPAALPVVSRADGRARVVFDDRDAATAAFPALLLSLRETMPAGGDIETTVTLRDERLMPAGWVSRRSVRAVLS